MKMQICCRDANLRCTYRNSNRQKPWH